MLVVDIETYDPSLKDKGCGAIRGDGHIVCVGLYDGANVSGVYRPNDPFVRDALLSEKTKVFHNAMYDMLWLRTSGFKINGTIKDTCIRAALIDPLEKHNTLNECCRRYGIGMKNADSTIEKWASDRGISNVWEIIDDVPFELLASYCLSDVKLTHTLYQAQKKSIERLDLYEVDMLESKLINVTLRMQLNGIKINTGARDALCEQYKNEIVLLEKEIADKTTIKNARSSVQIGAYFNSNGIHSPFTTPSGAESWDKDALKTIEHPIAEKISTYRSRSTVLTTFLQGALNDIDGRVYTQLFQTGRDEGGTITGRYSSAKPNLQNIPSDDEKGGKEIRSLFLPDDGMRLGAYDYKQIEYRLFAHYAIVLKQPGFQALYEAMSRGEDYHLFVQKLLGWVGDEEYTKRMRKITKTLNFGVLYGMGKAKCLKMYRTLFKPNHGQSVEEYVDWVYRTYFERLGFVKPTCRFIEDRAESNGYVRSVGGRRHPTEQGKEYKSVNKLIQGGAADIYKRGLVDAEDDGVWDVLPIHLPVHDETVFSIPTGNEAREATEHLKECMRYKGLKVPIDIDTEEGEDWAHVVNC